MRRLRHGIDGAVASCSDYRCALGKRPGSRLLGHRRKFLRLGEKQFSGSAGSLQRLLNYLAFGLRVIAARSGVDDEQQRRCGVDAGNAQGPELWGRRGSGRSS